MSYPQPPYRLPVPPKRSPRWPWVVGGVVLLFVLVGISVGGSDPSPPTRSSAGAASLAPTPVDIEPAPAAKPGPATSFDDGTYVVGEDVVAGTYKSAGARTGLFELCTVSTHFDDAASTGTVLDLQVVNANEPVRIKVTAKAKSVKASGCERFEKVG